ncbi:UDP-N-acetylmuramoyl-L-alanyl-D-glutamate--2,6-diaminopimelate ligase, partial [Treponema pallidum]
IAYDSRAVREGSVFFALRGTHAHGAQYIHAAIDAGACAIVHDCPLDTYVVGVYYARVPDARCALSSAAAAFYDFPTRALTVIGVTGTEGKSSTVSFIAQLLRLCGKRVGFISTVEYSLGDDILPNAEHQTTPESLTVQRLLAEMREHSCEFAVIEASSHGLSTRTARLQDVAFDVAVCMNVRHEHLEFHGSFEQYRFDKANVFRALDAHDHIKDGRRVPSFGVLWAEDASAVYFREATHKPCFFFKRGTGAEQRTAACLERMPCTLLWVQTLPQISQALRLRFVLSTVQEPAQPAQDGAHDVSVPLEGAFNACNIAASFLVLHGLLGTSLAAFAQHVQYVQPIQGRMQRVDMGQDFEVLIDYAHTPSSFEEILPPLAARVRARKRRMLVLFGSAGERDTQKRAMQGAIASRYAHVIVLTDEDPRGEDPMGILCMIAAGCEHKKLGKTLFLIPDRVAALRHIFSLARAQDLVLLLGKGHEHSIIYAHTVQPYDEERTARELLRASLSSDTLLS